MLGSQNMLIKEYFYPQQDVVVLISHQVPNNDLFVV